VNELEDVERKKQHELDKQTLIDLGFELRGDYVSIQLMSPASGDPSILNPYPVKCPETVSEGQEKKW
jgi:hypothetical protein